MSHEATAWAVQQRGISPAAKVVLWHLADRHNPDHGCFPSQARLANDCEMSRSSVNNQLAKLEAAGLIRRQQRRGDGARQMSTRYILGFEMAEAQEPSPDIGHGERQSRVQKTAKAESKSRVQNLDTNLVSNITSKKTSKGESDKPSEKPLALCSDDDAPASNVQPLAKRLWDAWPEIGRRRSSLKMVRAAIARLAGKVQPERLEAAVAAAVRQEYTPQPNGHGFTPSAPGLHRWLNDERYEAYLDAGSAQPGRGVARAGWEAALDGWLMRGSWDRQRLGPEPRESGCLCPVTILEARGAVRRADGGWRVPNVSA